MRDELTGYRDSTWSEWHRCQPAPLYGIDLDWVEVCKTCRRPLAIIECTSIPFSEHKQADIGRNLAALAGIRHYTLWYRRPDIQSALAGIPRNAHAERHAALMTDGNVVFQIRNERGEMRQITSRELSAILLRLHNEHEKAQHAAGG